MFQFCCQQMTDLNRKPYTIQMIQSDITLGKEEGSGEISQSDSFSADIFYTKNLIHKLTMPSAESWSVFQVCPENPSEPLGVWRSSEVKSLNHVRLFATPWAVAYQAPLSMGFSRQQSWSGLPFPSPGHLPNPGIKPRSPALQTDALPSEPPGKSQGDLRKDQKHLTFL